MFNKKTLLTFFLSITLVSGVLGAEKFKLDNSHTRVGFAVKHMVISTVRGNFTKYSGTVMYDEKDVTKSSINISIKTNSIDTDNEKRDGHLRSDDFFNAEKYPEIKFVSKSIKKSGKDYVAIGDLTIRDVTKQIELPFEILGVLDTEHGKRIGIHAETTIKRMEYGVKFNAALETGGLVVGDEVTIEIDAELVPDKPASGSNGQ